MRRIGRSLTHFGRRTLFRVRVRGESCWPVLAPGRAYWASALMPARTGDFIVFVNPKDRGQIFVKKIFGARQDGYEVGSLISWGSSSRDFGLIPARDVLGKVIRRWSTK